MWFPAPIARIDIADGLREGPVVAGKVLDGILTLAVRIILRFTDDFRAVLARVFAMHVHILDSHQRISTAACVTSGYGIWGMTMLFGIERFFNMGSHTFKTTLPN